jgi:hypothetical protein
MRQLLVAVSIRLEQQESSMSMNSVRVELRKHARRARKRRLLDCSQSAADGVEDQRLGMLDDLGWNCRISNPEHVAGDLFH